MVKVTTSKNFDFIQDSFIEAKTQLKEELRTGAINPERLKGVGLEGASRTGKSWDICVFICYYINCYQGKQINVCRDHFSNIRKTFYETLKKVWRLYGYPMHHFNKTASDIYFNDNIIRFVGVNDDIMTAHGLESDLLIINEAMGVMKESVDQLEQRCNEFFIYDYNPSDIDSYVYTLENRPDYKLLKTTIFDNKYTPLNAKQKILSYAHPDSDDYHVAKKAGYLKKDWIAFKAKNIEMGMANQYMWEVYGLGKRAVGEDIIFENWQKYSEEPNQDTIDWSYPGGDFGFKNDPTACVMVKKSGNNLYIKQHIYEIGLLNNDIADRLKLLGLADQRSIWDKAEEKSVYEMRNMNIDAWYCDKPPGSISFGIQKMHQFNIFIHEDSHDVIREFEKYRWAKDRRGNYKLNTFGKRIPVDKDNHTIDATRYVILYNYLDAVETQDNNN